MTEVGCRDDGPTNEGLAFSGTGYRLGEGHGPLETVSGPSFQAPSQPVCDDHHQHIRSVLVWFPAIDVLEWILLFVLVLLKW